MFSSPAPVSRPRFSIRSMSRAEVDLAVEWAAREGWNPGLHDADCFFASDPESFLLGELDGEPVGCVSAVRYGGVFGFAGFFIVRPEFRGQGNYGYALGQAAMQRLEGLNTGLDGVVAQQEHYRRLWGFRMAHRNVRYELSDASTLARPASSPALVPLSEVPFDILSAWDQRMFGAPRERFLACWISRPGTVALGRMEGGRLAGYGVLRPCRRGFKIGPLFAESPALADALFSELAARAGGEPVYLDIPQSNPAAVALAEGHGMTPVFETARMYTRNAPPIPLDCIYGITSFELG